MKSKYLLNILALLGVLVVLAGVTVAANTALAGDMGALEIYRIAQS